MTIFQILSKMVYVSSEFLGVAYKTLQTQQHFEKKIRAVKFVEKCNFKTG